VASAECRVVVIGDTPKDIAAAQAIGAESLAVATGPFTSAVLEASRPTWLFAHLAVDGALAVLLGAATST
jgi:phosphoglycolate phosphatase-like HAD superfamily hydrolase